MNWVEIESFWSLEEAELAASLLKANQVPCHLEGTAVAGNFWHLSNATGGVKLMVTPENVEQANQLLSEVDARKSGDHADDAETDAEQLEADPSSAQDQVQDFESDDDAADRYDGPDDADDDGTDRPALLSRLREQRGWLWLIILAPLVSLISTVLIALLEMIAR